MAKYSKSERAESLARLREILPPGSTVYTIVRSVSRSGMSRQISLFAKDKDGDPMAISFHAARVLGWTLKRGWHDAIHVDGCGMDMCFHTVYSLGCAIFPRVEGQRDPGYSLTARDL